MNSMGLTGNEQGGEIPANMPPEQRQWNQQTQPQSQQNSTMTNYPNNGWPGYQNNSMSNRWQRYNNMPGNSGAYSSWYSQQQYNGMANPSTNSQLPSQSQLNSQSNPNWNGMPSPTTAQSTPNLNRWYNMHQPPQQQQEGPFNAQNDSWTFGHNESWDRTPPTRPANNFDSYRGQQRYTGGYMPNQTPVANWWNHSHPYNNNYNWGGYVGHNTSASGTNVGPNNWQNSAAYASQNGWYNNAPNNWQGGNNDGSNANWYSAGQNQNLNQSDSGATVEPASSTVSSVAGSGTISSS